MLLCETELNGREPGESVINVQERNEEEEEEKEEPEYILHMRHICH